MDTYRLIAADLADRGWSPPARCGCGLALDERTSWLFAAGVDGLEGKSAEPARSRAPAAAAAA